MKKENNTQHIIQKNTKLEKYNYKLSSSDIAEILTEYLLDHSTSNVQRIADKFSISTNRIYQLARDDKNKNLVEESITKSKKNFSKKCDLIIDKALKKINKELEKEDAEINLNQLVTALGVLYDKSRLENGLSTNNTALQINISVDK